MANNGDAQSFQVRLESLSDFARELETQLDAVRVPTDQLTDLSRQPLALGRFAEAFALRDQHLRTAGQMQDLLIELRDALRFANEVTRTIRAEYEQADTSVAESYRALATGLPEPVPVGGAGDRGTVYVSQYVSQSAKLG